MTLGGAFGETFLVWRRSALRVMSAALVVFLPLELAAAAFDPANDVWSNRGAYGAVMIATSFVATPCFAGAIVIYLDQGGSALAVYGKLDGRIRALVLGSWLAGIGLLVGIVLLVIPGLIIVARWFVAAPAVVLEHRGATASLQRSNEIVKGATGRVLATVVAVILAAVVMGLVPAVVVEIAAPGFVSSFSYGLSFDVISLPFVTTASYVIYRRLAQRVPAAEMPVAPTIEPEG